jgi:hypothetical protein
MATLAFRPELVEDTEMSKQRDWVDEDIERRHKEEQEHARRQARKDKYSERSNSEKATPAGPRAKTQPADRVRSRR